MVFDLNGKEITVKKTGERSLYAFNNSGELTINDSSKNKTGRIIARGVQNLNDGILTINGGTIVACDTNGGAAIWNEATLYVNDGQFETTYVGTPDDALGAGCLNNSGTAYITGGTFESVNRRVYAMISKGHIELSPTFKEIIVRGAHGGLGVDAGTAIVNGGSYSSTEFYGLYVSNDAVIEDPNEAVVTVNDGVFNGASVSVWIGSDVNDTVNSTILIFGGRFEKNCMLKRKQQIKRFKRRVVCLWS